MFIYEFVIFLLILIDLSPTQSREVDPSVFGNVILKHEKDYYNRLLGNLVNINTKRLDSLKKSVSLAQVQVGLGHKGLMLSDDDGVLGLVIAVGPKSVSSETSDTDTSDDRMSSSSEEVPLPPEIAMMRSSWCKSCSKKAARRCRRACRKAVSNGCSSYNCGSRLKKRIKKQCRSRCRSEFDVSGSRSSGSE